MITRKNKSKTLEKDVLCNVNVNLMVESVTQIKSRIMINVDASVKNIAYVKKIIFGILPHVVVKMVNVQPVLLMSVITSDEIIGAGKNAIPTNFNEQNIIHKTQNF